MYNTFSSPATNVKTLSQRLVFLDKPVCIRMKSANSMRLQIIYFSWKMPSWKKASKVECAWYEARPTSTASGNNLNNMQISTVGAMN